MIGRTLNRIDVAITNLFVCCPLRVHARCLCNLYVRVHLNRIMVYPPIRAISVAANCTYHCT